MDCDANASGDFVAKGKGARRREEGRKEGRREGRGEWGKVGEGRSAGGAGGAGWGGGLRMRGDAMTKRG